MAGDETRDEGDRAFAEEVGYTVARSMSDDGGVATRTLVNTETGLQLLSSIEEQVRLYVRNDGFRTPLQTRGALTKDLTDILQSIEASEETGVPTLAGMSNGFDLNPVINILDVYTLEGFDLMERDPDRLFSRGRYSPDKAGRDPRIELIGGDEARRSLATLLTDTLRFSASGPSPPASGSFGFTVNTAKRGYVLDCWPQWGATRLRFGATTTTPVVGPLKSGRYHFEGKNGALVENDGSLSQVDSVNTSTILGW